MTSKEDILYLFYSQHSAYIHTKLYFQFQSLVFLEVPNSSWFIKRLCKMNLFSCCCCDDNTDYWKWLLACLVELMSVYMCRSRLWQFPNMRNTKQIHKTNVLFPTVDRRFTCTLYETYNMTAGSSYLAAASSSCLRCFSSLLLPQEDMFILLPPVVISRMYRNMPAISATGQEWNR